MADDCLLTIIWTCVHIQVATLCDCIWIILCVIYFAINNDNEHLHFYANFHHNLYEIPLLASLVCALKLFECVCSCAPKVHTTKKHHIWKIVFIVIVANVWISKSELLYSEWIPHKWRSQQRKCIKWLGRKICKSQKWKQRITLIATLEVFTRFTCTLLFFAKKAVKNSLFFAFVFVCLFIRRHLSLDEIENDVCAHN